MHPVSGSLVTCASANNPGGEAVTSKSGQCLARTVSRAEVSCSGNRKDEICTSSRMLSDMCINQADQPRHTSKGNEPEWLKLGALSCFPPEVLCKILSFLPLKDFDAVLHTAVAFNNCEQVRKTYLKCIVEELCHRYFGALTGNHKELESKRRHFSRHTDAALNRLRQVIPASDIDLMETTLRREPLYIASLLRKFSSDGRLTHKERLLHHRSRPCTRQGALTNLPDTNKLVLIYPSLRPQICSLTVWDATFDVSHPNKQNCPLYDATDRLLLPFTYNVFPDGRMAMCDSYGRMYIFDFSQSTEPESIRVIQPPKHHHSYSWRLDVISNDIVVVRNDGSFWLFDLRLPKGCELFRMLRHGDHHRVVAHFSGLLPNGELVSFEPIAENSVKIWQSLTSSTSEMSIFQSEEHIREVKIESDRFLNNTVILNRGGRIAFWGECARSISIYDVYRPVGQERIGSIDVSALYSCDSVITTPCGQLLVVYRDCNSKCCILTVWQLTDNLPVPVRRMNIKSCQACYSQVFSLKLIPDGRILAISHDHVFIIDLTKPEGREVVRTIRVNEGNCFRPLYDRQYDVAGISGELSVLAYHTWKNDSIQLLDYYAV